MARVATALFLIAATLVGCGAHVDPSLVARPIATGPGYVLAPTTAAVRAGAPVGRLRCVPDGHRVGAHVELFAHRRVVVVPAGIGLAPPLRAHGAYVDAARCSYPIRTREPTGLLELDPRAGPFTLGDLFAIWGQPLSASRLAGFRAAPGTRVAAYLDGRLWPGDPRSMPLRRHAVIVLEVAGHVAPHTTYRFPRGL
jgi:hypothetical protein